ncbi:MAG TPA: hypothetical protein PLD25_14285 [Chloroflexota bacterium]|nr:hypothetical protein [Chloroflexota bacterium]
MSWKSVVLNTLFMVILWFTVLLTSMMVHEVGHGVATAVSGWKNSTPGFGATGYYERQLLLDALDYSINSGVAPADWGREHALLMIAELARHNAPLQAGVYGGWLAQVVVALFVFFLVQWRVFRQEASAQARLFWGSFALFNFAWVGGLLFLVGFLPYEGSDGVVLKQVVLQDSVLAQLVILGISLGLMLFAYYTAGKIGPLTFAGFGLDMAQCRTLALGWFALTVLAGFIAKIPVLAPIVLLAVFIVPAVIFWRFATREIVSRVRPYMWFSTLLWLVVILVLAVTNSGFIINRDDNMLTQAIIKSHYCDQTNCLPEEVQDWVMD